MQQKTQKINTYNDTVINIKLQFEKPISNAVAIAEIKKEQEICQVNAISHGTHA
jgi:hypothetical protein